MSAHPAPPPSSVSRGPVLPGGLTRWILGGIVLGVVVGFGIGDRAVWLGEIGRTIIQAIKLAAAPLLVFTVLDALISSAVTWRAGRKLLGFACVNGCLALAVGLLISNVFEPGRHLAGFVPPGPPPEVKPITVAGVLENFVPRSLGQPLVENAVLPLVLMALLLGLAIRSLKVRGEDTHGVERVVGVLRQATAIVLGWIIALIPLAVFAVVARTVGEHGFGPLGALGAYVLAGVGGLILHPVLVYTTWLVVYVRMSLSRFIAAAREPVIYAAGANSSLATLPLTLRALDRLGVSKSSSTLGACVATNLNNDGIILYEAMAVLFVAQAHGLDLSLAQQVYVAGLCLIAAMGVAGVPEAGFVSLSLVLVTVGLPLEALPLLLTVDWILARGRSMVNVLSDMVLSLLIDRGSRTADRPGPGRSVQDS